jgi:uncharacterized membrane protein (DUF2068 family)
MVEVSDMPGPGKITIFSLFSFFYLIAGIALIAALFGSGSLPVHVSMLGALSLIVSYGLNRMKRWALFLTVLTALVSISFGCVTVYAIYRMFGRGLTEISLLSVMILYVTFSVVSLLYVTAKRDKFE